MYTELTTYTRLGIKTEEHRTEPYISSEPTEPLLLLYYIHFYIFAHFATISNQLAKILPTWVSNSGFKYRTSRTHY